MTSKKIIINKIEEDVCPYCNGSDLEYSKLDSLFDNVGYEVTCKSCNKIFEEWYDLTLSCFNVYDDKGKEYTIGVDDKPLEIVIKSEEDNEVQS